MGKASRDKGARGERQACQELRDLGFTAERVSGLECASTLVSGVDIIMGPGDCPDLLAAWKAGRARSIQVKHVAKNAPSVAKVLENADLGLIHFTEGPERGKTFVVLRLEDLPALARDVIDGAAVAVQGDAW